MSGGFIADMRHLCGTYATIKEICRYGIVTSRNLVQRATSIGFTTLICSNLQARRSRKRTSLNPRSKNPSGFKRVDNKPITYPTITAHLIEGNKTTVMLSDGRIGEVTCYYKDTFDPAVGVAEAYKKALGITNYAYSLDKNRE